MAARAPVSVAAILVAAGSGQRLGADVPKAFVELEGRWLVEYAVDGFRALDEPCELVLVVPPGWEPRVAQRLGAGMSIVAGGATRQQSVANGLSALTAAPEVVLVHDAARALAPSSMIARVVAAVRAGAAAVVPAVAVSDSMRAIDADGSHALDRDGLRAVQTPQGFRRDVLVSAHEQASGTDATDDATLAERAGYRVDTVEGAIEAFKITHPLDLALARALSAGALAPWEAERHE